MFNPYEAPGLQYIGHVSHPQVNYGQPLPVFEPKAPVDGPSINTEEGWALFHKRMTEENCVYFLQAFGRDPICIEEVEAWERSYFVKDFIWEGAM